MRTVIKMLRDASEKWGNSPYISQKTDGRWKDTGFREAEDEALREGWLWTGDLGYKDPDGFLGAAGREKALLIAADGEKYSVPVGTVNICDNRRADVFR
jgi:acyl-CoA synthetase (AMP-forming)/AMP-acid ligase II